MVVLEFSCNFDVIVGGDEYRVYLLHHLDQKSSFVILIKMLHTAAAN